MSVAGLSAWLEKGAICFLSEPGPRRAPSGLRQRRGPAAAPRERKWETPARPPASGTAPDIPLAVKVQMFSQQARGGRWHPHLGSLRRTGTWIPPTAPQPHVAPDLAPSPAPEALCGCCVSWSVFASLHCSEITGACSHFQIPGYLSLPKIHITVAIL